MEMEIELISPSDEENKNETTALLYTKTSKYASKDKNNNNNNVNIDTIRCDVSDTNIIPYTNNSNTDIMPITYNSNLNSENIFNPLLVRNNENLSVDIEYEKREMSIAEEDINIYFNSDRTSSRNNDRHVRLNLDGTKTNASEIYLLNKRSSSAIVISYEINRKASYSSLKSNNSRSSIKRNYKSDDLDILQSKKKHDKHMQQPIDLEQNPKHKETSIGGKNYIEICSFCGKNKYRKIHDTPNEKYDRRNRIKPKYNRTKSCDQQYYIDKKHSKSSNDYLSEYKSFSENISPYESSIKSRSNSTSNSTSENSSTYESISTSENNIISGYNSTINVSKISGKYYKCSKSMSSNKDKCDTKISTCPRCKKKCKYELENIHTNNPSRTNKYKQKRKNFKMKLYNNCSKKQVIQGVILIQMKIKVLITQKRNIHLVSLKNYKKETNILNNSLRQIY